MRNAFLTLREKYHPLFHLRQNRLFQHLTRFADVPIAINFPEISYPVYVSLSKNLSWVLSSGEAGETGERDHFKQLVDIGGFRRFFDVGANIGLYGFMFNCIVPDGTVTMIEPDEDNVGLIRRTLTRSALERIEVLQAAVSDKPGFLPFYKDELSGATGCLRQDGDLTFVEFHHRKTPRQATVKCVTLESLCIRGDPDFVKIDVEGAELRVLTGAEKVISRAHPALFFECDKDQGKVHNFLKALGYTFYDFSSMQVSDSVTHNTLALHASTHGKIIDQINVGKFLRKNAEN
jgi:FkbM family methyltransferase